MIPFEGGNIPAPLISGLFNLLIPQAPDSIYFIIIKVNSYFFILAMTSENVHVKPEISVTVTKTECQNEILANWPGSAEMKFWQTGHF